MIPGCEAPAEFVGIYDAYRPGGATRRHERFARLQPLLVFEAQTLDIFIASSKAILKSRRIIRSDALRAPNPSTPAARSSDAARGTGDGGLLNGTSSE